MRIYLPINLMHNDSEIINCGTLPFLLLINKEINLIINSVY